MEDKLLLRPVNHFLGKQLVISDIGEIPVNYTHIGARGGYRNNQDYKNNSHLVAIRGRNIVRITSVRVKGMIR